VGGHVCDASHVVPGRRESAFGEEPARQPLVGSSALCQRAGLTTSPIPYEKGIFEVQFDFIDHKLNIVTTGGEIRSLRLIPRTVADFYAEFMQMLRSLGINVKIWRMPVEVPNPIRFDQDRTHASYDPEYAHRFWRILVTVDSVFKEFRARFLGKASPVHFFWGSFDFAVNAIFRQARAGTRRR